MGKKKIIKVPAEEVDLSKVKYEHEVIKGVHLTGCKLKFFVKLVEAPLITSLIASILNKQSGMIQLLQNTVIPEETMYKPQFPPQDPEPKVVLLDENGKAKERVQVVLKCLPEYDPSRWWTKDPNRPFRFWKIRDYTYAYRSGLATPSVVAEHIISVIEDMNNKNPPAPLVISFDAEEVRKLAAASTERFREGNPLSILDGIFIAIKDDIDCHPYTTKGGTTWLHEVRPVMTDGISVSRLRSCGVIFVGKANMHELGMGTTGNNPKYGTPRNPYADDRYTGGSSSGPAAIVASGLCSAALGTDGGGSVRIPASLCGVVGLKTTHGRTDVTGSLSEGGSVEVIGPIASSVEDVVIVYSAILGSSPGDRVSMKPSPPCLPNLSSDGLHVLRSLRLGKYTEWFNDVQSTEISSKCGDVVRLLSQTHGCQIKDIVIPELYEMRVAHLVTIGSECLESINPDYLEGKCAQLTYENRVNMAILQSYTASDYIASQRLRTRLMYFHMETFKKVDVIVTPTTCMTAPVIPPDATKYGEVDMQLTEYLMQFVLNANFLGLPAITVPVGYDKKGLPVGLQFIGRPWGEATILRLAFAVEELCKDSRKSPASFYDVLKWQPNQSAFANEDGVKGIYRVDVDIPADDWARISNFYDVLVFNTGHWWGYDKFPKETPLVFFQAGKPIEPPLEMRDGLRVVLENMISYIQREIPNKTLKFWRLQSPRHFYGGEWNQNGSCLFNEPLKESELNLWFNPSNNGVNKEARELNHLIKEALQGSDIHLLDLTHMSEFRADAHPAIWLGKKDAVAVWGQDCMHWCLPGVPDTWFDILAELILNRFEKR